MRAFGQPSRRGTVATLSATVMCGKSPTCWMTYPIPRRSSVTSSARTLRSPIRMSPSLMSIRRLTIFMAVVFPAPEGPTRQQIAPAGIVSDSSRTAGSARPG